MNAFIFLTLLAAWVTHIVACIKASSWVLMLFGVFFFPVGIVHGVAIWLGAL